MTMDERDLRLDGNALAGMLAEELLRSHSSPLGQHRGLHQLHVRRRRPPGRQLRRQLRAALRRESVYDPDNLFDINQKIAPAKPR
jgi:hypothetical protein